MWQSKMSRSTGWQRPAVPPFESASQPGEKTSEQPSGKCGAICGGRCSATTSFFSSSTCSRTRCALRLMAFKCDMSPRFTLIRKRVGAGFQPALGPLKGRPTSDRRFRFRFLTVKAREEIGIALRQLAVDLQAGVGPAADPLAVVQVRPCRRAVAHVRLVIAAAGAERPCPTGLAIGLVGDVMLLQKCRLRAAIDPVVDGPELVRVGAGEAVAERDIAVGRHAE